MTNEVIKFANNQEISACNDFHNAYYGTQRTLEDFNWQFVNKVDSKKNLISCAMFEKEIVGTQAIIPIEIFTKNGKFLTAKSEETLISPKMRGKKLFSKLYAPLIDYCSKNNIQFIWGFTPADKAFKNNGFQIPAKTKQLLLSNNIFSLSKILGENNSKVKSFAILLIGFLFTIHSKLRFYFSSVRLQSDETLAVLSSKEDIQINWMQEFCKRWDVVTINRSEDYINWRIFTNPHIKANIIGYFKETKLSGYVAFAMNQNREGYIVDIITYDNSKPFKDHRIVKILLKEATNRLKRMGATHIRMWCFNSNKYDKLVKLQAQKLGYIFINKGSPVLFKQIHDDAYEGRSFDDWYVTRIYTDGENG